MPRVNFYEDTRRGLRKITHSRSMITPKEVTSLTSWFRQAQIAVPQIPNVVGFEWKVVASVASVDSIVFVLTSVYGQEAQIVIDRRSNNLGM